MPPSGTIAGTAPDRPAALPVQVMRDGLVSSAITSGLQDFTCETAATSNCTPPISKFFTPAPWPSWFIQK